LARHPGVAIAVVLGKLPADFKKSHVAPNLLLAEWFKSFDPAMSLAPWADLLVVSADEPSCLSKTTAIEKPIIVTRYLESPLDLTNSRAACDTLQRDLASIGQFAGYIV
jgi:hypothetical protein